MAHSDPIELLRRLVGFDTVSSNSNVALIEWAAERLDGAGFRTDVRRSADGRHANLFATVGPDDRGGVMLSGHSDVVPVDGQAWTSDPFTLTRRDDRLLARGSADMKGFIACVIARAEAFAAAALAHPVHVALSYNEESDMRGMRELAAQLERSPVRPAACIIGEPTSMQVVVSNKGTAIFRCKVRGHPVHSSLRDRGISAVEIASEMIVFLNGLQKELLGAGRDDGFEFPHTSVHAGMIHGGTAHNITAEHCEFVFEVRSLPGASADTVVDRLRAHCRDVLLPAMRSVSPNCDIGIEEVVNAPGLDEGRNRSLSRAIMPLCNCHRPGRVSFGTEAGFLVNAGVPTVVCGPGDIAVAHQPDEYVEVGQLHACMEFLEKLQARLCRAEAL